MKRLKDNFQILKRLEDNFNNEYFNFFVEVKDLAVGDANVFRISEWENSNKEAFPSSF